jgi:pimeloyl-ACP methyl ester carboxylesterase
MGAFVACVTASGAPDRVSSVVLVDGGVGFPTPPELDIDAALLAIIGPAMERLAITFPSRTAYLDSMRAHPALQQDWGPELEAYFERDLVGEPPTLRSSCVLEAVRTDGSDVLRDEATTTAIRRLACPATLLWAERGFLDDPHSMYDEQRLAAAALPAERVHVEQVPGVNHYTVLMGQRGARVVAEHLRKAAGV